MSMNIKSVIIDFKTGPETNSDCLQLAAYYMLYVQGNSDELMFNEELHRYTLKDGTSVPSVTYIIGETFNKLLGVFYGNDTAKYNAARGSFVHKCIEQIENPNAPLDINQLRENPEYKDTIGFIDAYLSFKQEYKPFQKVLPLTLNEQMLYNPALRYSGKIDMIFVFDDTEDEFDKVTAINVYLKNDGTFRIVDRTSDLNLDSLRFKTYLSVYNDINRVKAIMKEETPGDE